MWNRDNNFLYLHHAFPTEQGCEMCDGLEIRMCIVHAEVTSLTAGLNDIQ